MSIPDTVAAIHIYEENLAAQFGYSFLDVIPKPHYDPTKDSIEAIYGAEVFISILFIVLFFGCPRKCLNWEINFQYNDRMREFQYRLERFVNDNAADVTWEE